MRGVFSYFHSNKAIMTLLGYKYRVKIVVFGLWRDAITKLFFPNFLFLSLPFCSPLLVFAQFPAPTSFQISINYIHIDEVSFCNNQLVYGPNYCNQYSWQTPDTSITSAILTGYRVYKDGQLFLLTTANGEDTLGIYLGSFHVTAIYENPPGESEASNVIIVDDLPIATGEVMGDGKIKIGFNLSQHSLTIDGAMHARTLGIYNLQGSQVFYTDAVPPKHELEGFVAGAYLVVVRDRFGRVHSKVVLLGF